LTKPGASTVNSAALALVAMQAAAIAAQMIRMAFPLVVFGDFSAANRRLSSPT
jgi:hypothetical protein